MATSHIPYNKPISPELIYFYSSWRPSLSIQAVYFFYRLYSLKSFSVTARETNEAGTTVRCAIENLEQLLGFQLANDNGEITSAGERFYLKIQPLLKLINEIEEWLKIPRKSSFVPLSFQQPQLETSDIYSFHTLCLHKDLAYTHRFLGIHTKILVRQIKTLEDLFSPYPLFENFKPTAQGEKFHEAVKAILNEIYEFEAKLPEIRLSCLFR